MAKWQAKNRFLRHFFEWTRTRIFAREMPETWFLSARSFARAADKAMQGETLAGLHADCVMFVLDEAGGIPDAVMASAEAALSSCQEGHIVMAGNPTHLEGPLWRATTSERRLWHLTEITGDPDDPKRSTRVRPEWAREQIEKYGRDNPWVLVNVFGKFPPASLNTLIGPDDCRDATQRAWRAEEIARSARVLGVDVARFGDDASVIFPRQGLLAYSPQKFRNLDGNQGAGAVARKWADWNADAVFVDDTGGWGASWIDGLRRLGRQPIGIGFASRAADPRYANKRAEMYFDAARWIKGGGQLPTDCPELIAALTQTTYSFKGDQLLLEDKEQLKQRLGFNLSKAPRAPVPELRQGTRRRPGGEPAHGPQAGRQSSPL